MNQSKSSAQTEDSDSSKINASALNMNPDPIINKEPETGEALWGEAQPDKEKAKDKPMQQEEDDDDNEEGEFEVEKILDKKMKNRATLYLVKWKGFPVEDATWEPKANLGNCPLKIQEFETQYAQRAKKGPEVPVKVAGAKVGAVVAENKEEKKVNGEKQNKKINGTEKVVNSKETLPNLSIEPESILGKRPREITDKELSEKGNKIDDEEIKEKAKTPEPQTIINPKEEKKPVEKEDKKPPQKSEDKLTSIIKHLNKQGGEQKDHEVLQAQISSLGTFSEGLNSVTDQEKAKEGAESLNIPTDVNNIPKEDQSTRMEIEKLDSSEGNSKSATPQHDPTDKASEPTVQANQSNTKMKRKKTGEYGSLDKGDVPLKVMGIRPVKEANELDLEIMVSWKARDNGVKPFNSKVMRVDLLKKGFWMPLIQYYESKMKLESAPNFDSNLLPKLDKGGDKGGEK